MDDGGFQVSRRLQEAIRNHPVVAKVAASGLEIAVFCTVVGCIASIFGCAYVCLRDRQMRQLSELRAQWEATRKASEGVDVAIDWRHAARSGTLPESRFKAQELLPLNAWYAGSPDLEKLYRVA